MFLSCFSLQFFPDPTILPFIPVRVASFSSQLCNERRIRTVIQHALEQCSAGLREEISKKNGDLSSTVRGLGASDSGVHSFTHTLPSSPCAAPESVSSSSRCSAPSGPGAFSAQTTCPSASIRGARLPHAALPSALSSSSITCSSGSSPELQSISRLVEALNFRLSVVLATDSLFVDLQLSPRLTPRPYTYLSRHVTNARASSFSASLSPSSPDCGSPPRSATEVSTSTDSPVSEESGLPGQTTNERNCLPASSEALPTADAQGEGRAGVRNRGHVYSELSSSSSSQPSSPSSPPVHPASLVSASVSPSSSFSPCPTRSPPSSLRGSPYLTTPSCSPVIRELLNQDFTVLSSSHRGDCEASPEWSLARVTRDLRAERRRKQWEDHVAYNSLEKQGHECSCEHESSQHVYAGSLHGTSDYGMAETEKSTAQRHSGMAFTSRSADSSGVPPWKLSAFESLLRTLRRAERQGMRMWLAETERQKTSGEVSIEEFRARAGENKARMAALSPSLTTGDGRCSAGTSNTEPLATLTPRAATEASSSSSSSASVSTSPDSVLSSPGPPLFLKKSSSPLAPPSRPGVTPPLDSQTGAPVPRPPSPSVHYPPPRSSLPAPARLSLPVEVELLRLRQLYFGRHVASTNAAGLLPPAALTSSAGLAEAYEADDAAAAAVALASGVRRAWKREADVVVRRKNGEAVLLLSEVASFFLVSF